MTQYTKVWQLLEDPKRWTQGSSALDKSGKPVDATDPQACCWCLIGAIQKIYRMGLADYFSVVDCIHNRLFDFLDAYNNIAAWNDAPSRTHAEILALCKELDI